MPTKVRRAGTRYAESRIRTRVTSRIRADSPDHHGTTYDDLERTLPVSPKLTRQRRSPNALRPLFQMLQMADSLLMATFVR
jgi:hypothetical protein